jgi:hypothetical protein
MQTSMKPLFMRERAMRFLEVTVVHSMEGVLFALLSAVFTLAGAAAFVEDSSWLAGRPEMTASAPAAAAPVLAARPPQPAPAIQQASYVPPNVQ